MFNFTEDENIKVIIKLNRDTASGKVKWSAASSSVITLPHDGQVIGKVYRTPFKGKYFQIFRYRYKNYSPDFDEFYYTSTVKLEIADLSGEQEWEFPPDNSLNDLYETVRLKSGNVDNVLASFLDEE